MRKGQRGVCVIYVRCAYAAWATIKPANTHRKLVDKQMQKHVQYVPRPCRGGEIKSGREEETLLLVTIFMLGLAAVAAAAVRGRQHLPCFSDWHCRKNAFSTFMTAAGHWVMAINTRQKNKYKFFSLLFIFFGSCGSFSTCEWHTRWSMSSPQFCGCP